MTIIASLSNTALQHSVTVTTNGNEKSVQIFGKTEGRGSSVNGGELLFLALATCFCNDVYREAAKRNMSIDSVDVKVEGEFGKEGEPGRNIQYVVDVKGPYSKEEIGELIRYVDAVAEIHNTLRQGAAVTLRF